MRAISNLILFTMAVCVILDVYVTAPSGLAAAQPTQVQYMVASR